MFRSDDCYPGGQVLYADRGFDLILSLPARSLRSVGFDGDLLLEDVRIDIELLMR